jgi:hypothetical protein
MGYPSNESLAWPRDFALYENKLKTQLTISLWTSPLQKGYGKRIFLWVGLLDLGKGIP